MLGKGALDGGAVLGFKGSLEFPFLLSIYNCERVLHIFFIVLQIIWLT